MKKETTTIKEKKLWMRWVAGGVILAMVLIYGFSFVLNEGNLAVVTRFGAPRAIEYEAGLHLRLPWPFEKVYFFDKRKHYYDTSYIETLTMDKKNIILQTYIIWNIDDPLRFLQSAGDRETAEANLDSLVTSAKNSILGKYNLSALVSVDEGNLQISQIEAGILADVQEQASTRYGVCVSQIGLKRLGLPDANITYVFDQMRAERQKYVEQLKAEGERDASMIRNEADVKAAELVSEGIETAAQIKGEAELESAKIYAEAYRMNPGFYSFLRRLDSMEKILNENATLIFKNDSPPFNVLSEDQ